MKKMTITLIIIAVVACVLGAIAARIALSLI